jgi:hypothetical protein
LLSLWATEPARAKPVSRPRSSRELPSRPHPPALRACTMSNSLRACGRAARGRLGRRNHIAALGANDEIRGAVGSRSLRKFGVRQSASGREAARGNRIRPRQHVGFGAFCSAFGSNTSQTTQKRGPQPRRNRDILQRFCQRYCTNSAGAPRDQTLAGTFAPIRRRLSITERSAPQSVVCEVTNAEVKRRRTPVG